jgi:hypothetical protein
MADIHERFDEILDEVRTQEAFDVRDDLAQAIKVGPFDDRGVAEPGRERGAGFAMFIGEWRLGWWATRAEACDVAQLLAQALRHHRTDRDERRRARRVGKVI